MYTIMSVQAGVSKRGKQQVEFPASDTPEIINASKTTNDGVKGRWHFRVDCSKPSDCIGLLRSYYVSQQC